MSSMRDHARALAQRGFRVFPIKSNAKAPPLLVDWPAKSTGEIGLIDVLWGKWPDANIGIHCAGLLVVDVDTKNDGLHSLARLMLSEGMPETLTSITPSGGRHLFYRLPDGHPGVPNSVGVLGSGLDIRSTGGYVVAPGSVTEVGEYRLELDVPIADAPEWLVQKLGTFTPRERREKVNVPDAPDMLVARAREWIKSRPVNDEAYKTACGLRDLGLSETQAFLVLTEHDSRAPALLASKVEHAYRYAVNEAGVRVAKPGDFPAVAGAPFPPPVTPAAPPAPATPIPGGPPRLIEEISAGEARSGEYLVKGLLSRRSYAELFGSPGAGKTFVALDLAYHVAAGKPWMGRRVWQGPVLYLAYEGTGGLANRGRALRKQYGNGQVPLYVHPAGFNLREQAGRQALGQAIAAMPDKPALIVVDTFARALMGGDENSAQDVGAFNQSAAALIEATGACVLIIHHTGKNKSAGARGSSALLAAVDTELEIDEHGRIVTNKQRDMLMAEPIGFNLVTVELGRDRDNEPVTSCVVAGTGPSGAKPKDKLKGNPKRGFHVLCELSPMNQPVALEAWKKACLAFLPVKSFNARFWDIRSHLVDRGYVAVDAADMVVRKMEG